MRNQEQKNEDARKARAWNKSHGICYNCRQADAAPGRSLCKPCYIKLLKSRKRRDPDGSKDSAYHKQLRESRKALGLCTQCGRKTDGIHVKCKACRRKAAEYMQVVRIKKRIKEAAHADHRTQ